MLAQVLQLLLRWKVLAQVVVTLRERYQGQVLVC